MQLLSYLPCPTVSIRHAAVASRTRKSGQRYHNTQMSCRIIKVPVGTCISPLLELDAEQPNAAVSSCSTDEAEEEQPIDRGMQDRMMADLHLPAATAVVARGGMGGRGSVSKGRGTGDLRYANDAFQLPT